MLNTLYGWYLQGELSCVFDTLTFTEEMKANTTDEFTILDARYGDIKKLKLGTFNFIITRIFSASTGVPLEVEVLPDGDLLNGFVSIVWTQREVEPTAPLVLTMDLQLKVINDTGSDTDMFMVFEGFWIPRALMSRLDELADMVVTSPAKIDNQTLGTLEVLEDLYKVMRGQAPAGGVGMPAYRSRIPTGVDKPVPYCQRRRF